MNTQLFAAPSPIEEIVARVARRLWPVKTAANLAMRAGRTPRSAEGWLSQQTGMSADALAELLRSDAGLHVLRELIGSQPPSWWPAFADEAKAAGIERRLEAIRAEIDEAKRGLAQR